MKILNLCLAAVMGLLVGAFFLRIPATKAAAQPIGQVHVSIFPVGMLNAKGTASENLPGLRIVGISCIPKPTPRLPDAAVCYVATTLAGN